MTIYSWTMLLAAALVIEFVKAVRCALIKRPFSTLSTE
jgi:hypothetical protein